MLSMLLYEALKQVRDDGADGVRGDIRPLQDWRNTCELKLSPESYMGFQWIATYTRLIGVRCH